MFDGDEILMHEDTVSFSVTLFSFVWSIQMGKHDTMP